MYLSNPYIIIILLISLSCNNQNKWNKGVGDTFTIKRQESYNYSEMLSGDLDSTTKNELEKYKDSMTEKNKHNPNDKNLNPIKEQKSLKEKFNSFLIALFDIYNNFIKLFK